MLLAPLSASAAEARRVAVLEFSGDGSIDEQGLITLADKVRGEALKHLDSATWQVITRENMLVLVQANADELDACVGECEVETGRLVGADLVVAGSAVTFGTRYTLLLKAYDTATANLLASEEVVADDLNRLWDDIPEACAAMFGTPATRTPPDGGRGVADQARSGGGAGPIPEWSTGEAADAWAQRDTRRELASAIQIWQDLLAARPDDADLLVQLSRAQYTMATLHPSSSKTDLTTLQAGVDYAERALALDTDFRECARPQKSDYTCLELLDVEYVAAALWLHANLELWSRQKGFTYIVKSKTRLKHYADWIQVVDPDYYHGAGDRILGHYHASAPAAFGGDLGRAKEHFEKSLGISPDFLSTKVMMARYYARATQDRTLFQRLCQEVIDADPTRIPDLVPEQEHAQSEARGLLSQISVLF